MSRTLLLEVKLVQAVLCKLSALGRAKAERPNLPSSLPQPALPAGQGTRDEDAGSPAPPRPGPVHPHALGLVPAGMKSGGPTGKQADAGLRGGVA